MPNDGVPEFAAMGLRAADSETIERVRQALFVRGYIDPNRPGYVAAEAYGACSTFVVVPEGEIVSVSTGVPASVMDAAQAAYSLGATWVSVWSEHVDEIIPRVVEDTREPQAAPSPWEQDVLPV